jgi:hypothetical protein
VLQVASMVLTLIFACELVIKLLGMGLYEYFSDNFNTFDAFVTLTSLVELAVIPPSFNFSDAPASLIYEGDMVVSGGAGISVLRLCRLFRLLKLVTKFDSLREIAATVIAMVPAVGNFCLLIIIFLVIMALFGSQIIANRLRFDSYGYPINYWDNLEPAHPELPNPAWLNASSTPTNFDDFVGSFFAVFQIMSGEDWNVVFYDAMRGEGLFGGFFVLFSLLLGSLLLLNTFVAVMLDEFEQARKRFELLNKASTKVRLTKVRESMSNKVTRRPSSYYDGLLKAEEEGTEDTGEKLAGGMDLGEGLFTFEVMLPRKDAGETTSRFERRANASSFRYQGCGFDLALSHLAEAEQFHGRLVVTELNPRSDAAAGGLREGDRLWHVDGDDIRVNSEDEKLAVLERIAETAYPVRLLVVRDEHAHKKAGVSVGVLVHGHSHPQMDLSEYEETSAGRHLTAANAEPVSLLQVENELNATVDLNAEYEETEVARKKGVNIMRSLSSRLRSKNPENTEEDVEGRSRPSTPKADSNNDGSTEEFDFALDMLSAGRPADDDEEDEEDDGREPGEEPWRGKEEWRNRFLEIVVNQRFKAFIFGLIILSSLCLTWDNPLNNPDNTLFKVMKVVDIIFTTLFIIEMTLKVLALGMVCGKRAYIRDPWNQLDFVVVCISVVLLFSESGPLKSLRALRCLRALRALRLLSRFPEMKAMVNALFLSLPNVGYVCMFIAMIFLLFAILFINFLKGTFYACQGPVYTGLTMLQQELIDHPKLFADLTPDEQAWAAPGTQWSGAGYPGKTSHAVCDWLGAEWYETIPENFNNIATAMLTLFEICTTEGWVLVMRSSMDSTGIDMQPIRNASRSMCVLYFVFMMVCAIFMINLFVGVLVDNFVKLREEGGGQSVLLTDAQHAYLELQRYFLLVTKGTGVDDGELNAMANPQVERKGQLTWELSANMGKYKKYADNFIYCCIVTNVLLLASEHLGQDAAFSNFLEVANFIFAVVFTLEAIIKIKGITFFGYMEDHWNKYDFFLVVACDAGLVVAFCGAGVNLSPIFQMLRVFRVARIMRVIRTMPGLKALLKTIGLMIPYLGNIGALMFIVFFIYAVMGMQLFAKIAIDGKDNLDHRANFQSFAQALVTLWRCATGEFWSGIMHDLAADSDGCVTDPKFDPAMCGFQGRGNAGQQECVPLNGCGSTVSYAYFCSFCLIVTFVFVNLFITTILETFDKSTEDIEREDRMLRKLEKDKDSSGFNRHQTTHFCKEWNKTWKRYATALAEETNIRIEDVPREEMGGEFFFDFMCAMKPPMGLAARRGSVGTYGEQITDEEIWKRLELISVFPKQIVRRTRSRGKSLNTGGAAGDGGEKEDDGNANRRMSISFRNATSTTPPMPPLDMLIYHFDDAVTVRA